MARKLAPGTKFAGMPGHVPSTVRLEIKRQGYGGKGDYLRANNEYFDIDVNSQTQDWDGLALPDPKTKMAEMFAPKKSKRYGGKKDVFIDNYPVKVKLASASQSSAYRGGNKETIQVLIPQGYIVDMTSDVFFEALMRDGLNHETKELNSEFIVVTLNRGTRLVRVGSDLHNAALERMASDNKPRIDVKTMSAGEVFETTSGTKAVFLGFVSTKYLKTKVSGADAAKAVVAYSSMKIGTLWLTLDWRHNTTGYVKLQQTFDLSMQEDKYFWSGVTFKTKSGHGYVHRCKGLRVDVPNEMIRLVRLNAIRAAESDLKEYGDDTCHRFQALIDQGIIYRKKNGNKQPDREPYRYAPYRGAATNKQQEPFSAPSWWAIQRMIKGTKLTNMTVFGMQPEAHPCSLKLEKVIELFNKMNDLRLISGLDYTVLPF